MPHIYTWSQIRICIWSFPMLNFRCLDVQCIHIWRVKFVGGGEKCWFEVQMHPTLITSHLPPSLYRIGLAIIFLARRCISDLWTLFSAAAGGSFERFVLCNSMMCNLLSLTLTLKSAVFLASCIYLYVQQELLCQEYRFVLCVVFLCSFMMCNLLSLWRL